MIAIGADPVGQAIPIEIGEVAESHIPLCAAPVIADPVLRLMNCTLDPAVSGVEIGFQPTRLVSKHPVLQTIAVDIHKATKPHVGGRIVPPDYGG